jgi:hypothetical protein
MRAALVALSIVGLSGCLVRGGAPALKSAVEFSLPDQATHPTSLDGLVAHGPLVIFFYRGHW